MLKLVAVYLVKEKHMMSEFPKFTQQTSFLKIKLTNKGRKKY